MLASSPSDVNINEDLDRFWIGCLEHNIALHPRFVPLNGSGSQRGEISQTDSLRCVLVDPVGAFARPI